MLRMSENWQESVGGRRLFTVLQSPLLVATSPACDKDWHRSGKDVLPGRLPSSHVFDKHRSSSPKHPHVQGTQESHSLTAVVMVRKRIGPVPPLRRFWLHSSCNQAGERTAGAEAELGHKRSTIAGAGSAPCRCLSHHLHFPHAPTWPTYNLFNLALGTAKLFLRGSLAHSPAPLQATIIQLDMVTSVRQNSVWATI